MRLRSLLLVLGIVLLAAFVALNLPEFTRVGELNLGYTRVQAPLGMVMLIVLVAALLLFILGNAYTESAYLAEHREAARELQAQRDLAERAEASRFTELRQYLIDEGRNDPDRDARMAQMLDDRMARLYADLETRIDQNGNALAAYIGELEDRLERTVAGAPRYADARSVAPR